MLQQYPTLRSVDMRYGKQVVLDTGSVSDGSSVPLNDSTDAMGSTLDNDAALLRSSKTAAASDGGAKTTPRSAKHMAASAHSRTTHHKSPTHSHDSRHRPERGHRVKHPIMHVVSGM